MAQPASVHLRVMAGFTVCGSRASLPHTDVLDDVTCEMCKHTRVYKWGRRVERHALAAVATESEPCCPCAT